MSASHTHPAHTLRSGAQQLVADDDLTDLVGARADLEELGGSVQPVDLGFPRVPHTSVDLDGVVDELLERAARI